MQQVFILDITNTESKESLNKLLEQSYKIKDNFQVSSVNIMVVLEKSKDVE